MRLIDKDALFETLVTGDIRETHQFCYPCKKVLEAIDAQPTVEPQLIKGRWERKESDLSWWYECSSCGESPLFDPYENEVRTPFCPWCGAEMQDEQEQEPNRPE